MANPRQGQCVRIHYAKAKAPHMPHHAKHGTVAIVGKGRPRNHGIMIDGQIIAVPCGNLHHHPAAKAPAPRSSRRRGESRPRAVSINDIMAATCEHLGIGIGELLDTSSRDATLVLGRAMVVYLARAYTHLSYPEIAMAMAQSHHSTSWGAKRRMVRLLADERFMQPQARKVTGIYCPLGHSHIPVGRTEKELLEERLERERARSQRLQDEHDTTVRRLRAAKGQVTKIKKRVGKGACPCCNRRFENLHDHMKAKHPDYCKKD